MIRVLIFIILMSPISVLASSCDVYAFFGFTDYDGKKYSFHAPSEVLAQSPKWNPESNEPPLSFGKAKEIAENWSAKSEIKLSNYFVTLINRGEFCDRLSGHWVYLFHFRSEEKEHLRKEGAKMVGVLMNGELLLPEIDDRPHNKSLNRDATSVAPIS